MDMYLHVRITVARDQLKPFIEKAKAFLATDFVQSQPNGWTLLAACELVEANGYTGDVGQRPLKTEPHAAAMTFINVWKLPATLNVPEVMMRLSEYGPYVELDQHVTDESQDVIFRVNAPSVLTDGALAKKFKAGGSCAMVRHYLNRANLAEFAVSSGALAPSWEGAETALTFGGTYQNITGLLNEFWDLWLLEEGQNCAQLRAKLSGLITGSETTESKSYRHAIEFPGPDDGILILKAAPYWA